MPTTLTKDRVKSDLFGRAPDKGYQCESVNVRNTSGAAVTVAKDQVFGQPVKWDTDHWEFVLATDEANATAIVFEGPALDELANNGEVKCAILRRGPMVLKSGGWPAKDIAGTNLTTATIETQLAALSPPILVATDNSVQEEADI